MVKYSRVGFIFIIFLLITLTTQSVRAQCTNADIMEPGFSFLTSSRGCAPFDVQIQTEYFSSTVGTIYYVDWGDGSPEEQYVQTGTTGVVLQHTFPNSPIECGYDVIIDASNTCNPRGSVTPVETQVIVWTNDVISINPQTFRVCQGFAEELQFTDNSDWNCFPRDTRENDLARWIQWIYGTDDGTNRIPGITIDSQSPSSYPYNDPDPNYNPFYPVTSPGMTTLPIQVPVTSVADIGKEFEITLKNWNQCNPYDNNLDDGNALNPVNGDLINGDNSPITTTAKIVIVPSPEPDFQTRAGNASGPLQSTFCIDDNIYFENLTPAIAGAGFAYTWEFYDNDTGTGTPTSTSTDANPIYSFSTSGIKVVRLMVRDTNAAGNCEAIIDLQVFVSPVLQAAIGVTDLSDTPITPEFCQSSDGSQVYDVRFHDESYGTITSDIRWRWEFFDQNNTLVREEPGAGAYSSTSIGPFDMQYQETGTYKAILIVLDNVTGCISSDTAIVSIQESPVADFNASSSCEGDSILITDASTSSGSIISWSYDLDNDNMEDTTFNSSESWSYLFSTAGSYTAQLTVTSDNGCQDSVEQVITIYETPETIFSADRLSGCSELVVNFTNNSWNQSTNVEYYSWLINSGNGFVTDSTQSPSDPSLDGTFTRTFANPNSTDKIYKVILFARGANGCDSYSDTLDITVTPGASSGFLYTNYSPFNNNCSPLEINFEADQATQNLSPDDYSWTVSTSDSVVYQQSTGTTPYFSYVFENADNSVKDFEVTLSTNLSGSCSSDSTLIVKINPVPVAAFTIDTLFKDCDQMELSFIASQKGLSNYKWVMEAGGATIFSQENSNDNFSYNFVRGASDQDYKITLTTTNLVNCTSSPESQIVNIPKKEAFTASFEVTPLEQSLPNTTVTINDTSTPGSWDYLWDFGDGTTSTDPSITSYTYKSAGTYVIQLTLSDGVCEKSYNQSVKITSPPPVAEFEYDPANGCSPLKVTFTNLSQYANSYSWDFGDGNTSQMENPVHLYTSPGTYSVELTVVGDGGEDIIYKQDIITVYEKPLALFDVRPDLVYIPDMPVYTNNLSEGATRYLWDFDDGVTSEEFEPTHYYEEPGQFNITLFAYNDYCYDSLTAQGVVTARESGRVLIPNAFTPNRSGPSVIMGGENDIFLPLLANVSEFKLQIYNRWGELLFEGYNEGWNGYYEGKLCPQDVYVYKLEITFNNGDQTTKVGDVNLIR